MLDSLTTARAEPFTIDPAATADLPAEPAPGGVSVAVGVLLFGLFHARGLAFGRE